MSALVALRGGSATTAVDPDQLDALAVRLSALAGLVEREAMPALLRANQPGAATVLDPAGAAEVLARSAHALTLAGLTVTTCLALAVSLRAAAAAYREADSLSNRTVPLLQAARRLPGSMTALAKGHYQQALTADPELADAGVELLTRLDPRAGWLAWLAPDATARTAAGLAGLYRDGRPLVISRPDGRTLDADGPPRSVADLMREVAIREGDDAEGGAGDIRILDGPRGRRVVVDLAGTTSWDFDPRSRSRQPSDVATNLRALANQPSVLALGVRQALRQAGVGPADPIMLVGHSQGGMVAAQLAAELSRDHEFTVTHVVTAGSPVGLALVPRSISMLSLENRGDLVPELDGAVNPARPNWLTAQVAHGDHTVLGRHSVDSYLAGAADFDHTEDQAVRQWRQGAAAYLRASTVHTNVFRIERR